MGERIIVIIKLDNKQCEITPYLSFHDLEVIASKDDEGIIDYKHRVAEIIAFHTGEMFTEEDLYNADQAVLDEYIVACASNDDVLGQYYNGLDIADTNERYIKAIEATSKHYANKIAEAFNESLTPALNQISYKMQLASQNLIKAMGNGLTDKFKQAYQPMLENISSSIKTISQAYIKNYSDIDKTISRIVETYKSAIQNIKIPSISEEYKGRIIESYSVWGSMGWTIPPNADFNMFCTRPNSLEDAYTRIKQYTQQEDLEELFEEIMQCENIKMDDANEAIECFVSSHYKACSLIIFGMIDARLIQSQTESYSSKGKRRSSGVKAAEKLFSKIKESHLNEGVLFSMLLHVNILEAIRVIFKDGDDFKVQPDVINRNFVGHGMLERNVTEEDCILLFLLLYNFTVYINIYDV